jgi:hypothetical protein
MRAEEAPIEAPASGTFDLVVLGTGLVEALVAGCAPRCAGLHRWLRWRAALAQRVQRA